MAHFGEPFSGKNTSFFQGFVRVQWHNPETPTHVGKYQSVGNLHKVRSMVLSGRADSQALCHCWIPGVLRCHSFILGGWE